MQLVNRVVLLIQRASGLDVLGLDYARNPPGSAGALDFSRAAVDSSHLGL